jgi:hypothetical protein
MWGKEGGNLTLCFQLRNGRCGAQALAGRMNRSPGIGASLS